MMENTPKDYQCFGCIYFGELQKMRSDGIDWKEKNKKPCLTCRRLQIETDDRPDNFIGRVESDL